MSITVRPALAADIDTLVAGNVAMALEAEHKRLDPATVQRGVRASDANFLHDNGLKPWRPTRHLRSMQEATPPSLWGLTDGVGWSRVRPGLIKTGFAVSDEDWCGPYVAGEHV